MIMIIIKMRMVIFMMMAAVMLIGTTLSVRSTDILIFYCDLYYFAICFSILHETFFFELSNFIIEVNKLFLTLNFTYILIDPNVVNNGQILPRDTEHDICDENQADQSNAPIGDFVVFFSLQIKRIFLVGNVIKCEIFLCVLFSFV